MGLFKKKKSPPPPTYKTAGELFSQATTFAKSNFPLAYGARENALSQINAGALTPEPSFYDTYNLVNPEQLSPDYFSQFGPTSFEQALGNQYFANILPESERRILHGLSLSGIESSPVLAELLAKNYGNLAVPIGEYLASQGQRRAELGLNRYSDLMNLGQRRAELGLQGIQQGIQAGLNIDPYSTYSPYLETDISQSNAQENANYQAALVRAQKSAGISSIGSILGGVGGFMIGGPAGASLGASLGGSAASLFGGSGTPVNFSDALSFAQAFPSTSKIGQVQSVRPNRTNTYSGTSIPRLNSSNIFGPGGYLDVKNYGYS